MNFDEQLRRLDPAQHLTDDLSSSPRALATLTRVMQVAPGGAAPRGRMRRIRYSLAAAVAAVGVVVAPVLGGGSTAFAEWTAKARSATAEEKAHWAERCGQSWGHDFDLRLVEIRGHWVMTYMTAPDGYEATCLDSNRTSPVNSELPNGQGMTASLTGTPAPNGLITNSVKTARLLDGVMYAVSGKAGSDVVGVSIDAGGVYAEATLKDGYFTAWWPAREPDSLLKRLTHSGPPNPDVTITLRDGSSRTQPIQDFDVSPTWPEVN